MGICLAAATSASAVTIELNYDGSYDPTSATPPTGQDTWIVVETGSPALTWDDPTGSGYARIDDNSTGARIALHNTIDQYNGGDPASMVWEYSIRMSMPTTTPYMYPRTFFGVRDEGGAGGRAVLFAHSATGDNFFYTVGDSDAVVSPELYTANPYATPPIPGLNDGEMHDYRMVKHLDGNDVMVVDFYLDSGLIDTRPYTTFTTTSGDAEGVGIWTATNGECDYTIDSLYFTTDVSAELPPLIGDASGNGVVDSGDAAILAANWLQSDVGWGDGDFNYDDIVDDIDATMMAANWGATSPSATAVPEPSVLILLAGGLLALGFRKRRTAGV